MPIINIGSQNYSYPEEGEKKWGDKLRDIIVGFISYATSRFEKTMYVDEDQTILGVKSFENIPKVFVGDGEDRHEVSLVHREEVNLIKGAGGDDYDELKSKVLELEKSLEDLKVAQNDNLVNYLGGNSPENIEQSIKNDLKEFNKSKTTSGGANNLLFSTWAGISSENKNISMSTSISALAKLCDSLVPIGTIAHLHLLSNDQQAQWIDYVSDVHDVSQRVLFADGTYKILTGGPWAPCDGTFVLPPIYFGRDDRNENRLIPDLTESFLSGAGSDNLGIIKGENEKYMHLDEIPYHEHGVTHYHDMYVFWKGVKLTSIPNGAGYNPVVTHITSYDSDPQQGNDLHPWGRGSDLSFDGKKLISIIAHGNTGNVERSNLQRKFDNRPKSLGIRFFMRVQ